MQNPGHYNRHIADRFNVKARVAPQLNGIASKVVMRIILLDFGVASLEAVEEGASGATTAQGL